MRITIAVKRIKDVLQVLLLVHKTSTEFLIFCFAHSLIQISCFHNLTVSLIPVMRLNISPSQHLLAQSKQRH